MVHPWVFVSVLASLPLSNAKQSGSSPLQLNTSSKSYGPDGPWHAVTVWLGSERTAIDLYPGGQYGSIILSDQACESTSSPCGSGGVFNGRNSITFDNHSIQYDAFKSNPVISWDTGALKYRGVAEYAMDRLAGDRDLHWTVQNLSIILASNISMVYPDGSRYPPQVGKLALGSPAVNQTFTADGPSINASLLTGSLEEQNQVSSSSYGLHVGSASLGPELSLWIGGYDASRITGLVSVQPIQDQWCVIDLLDIGIGVDHGGSPFSFTSRDRLLTDVSSSAPSISVTMDPSAPYLALPNSTCAAIAKNIPVTYQTKYGLYFWNVDDVQYQRIVTSPSYLSFTFRASGPSITRLVIKVPFKLLNLTLEAPLIDKPTFYFPCQPPQDSSTYSLGRAFLQAAFLGVNWDEEPPTWYLAQAPGPNTSSSPFQIDFGDNVAASSTASWNDTWEGSWIPLADNSSKPNQTSSGDSPNSSGSSSSKRGLTAGAKAGIAIGCAAIVIAVLLGIVFYRRRSPESLKPTGSSSSSPQAQFQHPVELAATGDRHRPVHELNAGRAQD
ncbi:hypothetical protein MMC22_005535 [Lobaria immixta]|nr:hypothetical protein [Lobaria immixta]